jgi:hypothetical protein
VTISAGETFTVVIDPDTALEEIVDVTAVSTNTLTITRAIDGSSGQAHSAGAVVRHMAIGRDYRDANTHVEASSGVHGVTGSVVGTSDTQTLTNKTINAASNTISGITSSMITDGTIVNGDISSSAAIAYSKLALTGTITSSDIANDTIVDGDINTAANIAWTKIAPSSTVSATELGYLDGVTSAIQTQIDSKLATSTAASTYAPLASPALTGTPTAPTATAGTSTTQVATTQFVSTAVSNLVASAPSTLDTLNELASALGNDAAFSTTVTNSIAAKLPLAGGTMSGAIAMGTNKITGMGTPTASTDAATKGYVDTVTVAPSNLTGPITSTGSATAIASQTGTGTTFVMNTSPTLVTPTLGVATATSVNGTTIPSSKTLVVTTDKLSVHAATSSSELAGVISDETGSGALVFGTAPTVSLPVIDNIKLGYTTTATAAGTTTLTAASNRQQLFTGTTTQTIVLPVTSTLTTGMGYEIENNSTGNLTINSSGGNLVATVVPGVTAHIMCIGTTLTTAADWDADFEAFSTLTGTGSVVLATSPTLITPNLGTPSAISLTNATNVPSDATKAPIASPTFTGTVTIPTVAAGTTSTATVGAGYMGLPQNGTTTGAYTVAAADAGKHIYSTATRTITIDSNANLALPVGTTVTFIAGSGATVTIAITTDTMYLAGLGTTGSRTLAAFGMATAVKIASTTWIISGNGLT